MPRIRTVKPEIHQDEAVGELSDSAFRLYIGLITQADDAGRLKGDPRLLCSQVWPYQPKTTEEIDVLLGELADAGLIVRYTVEGRPFVCLPTWAEHQRVDNAGKSRIPSPDEADGEVSPRPAATRGDSPLDQGRDQGEDQGPRSGRAREAELAPVSDDDRLVLAVLQRITFSRSLPDPKVPAVCKANADFADRDLGLEADKFAHYFLDGAGENRRMRDVVATWRNWLRNAPRAGKARSGGGARDSVAADLERLEAEKRRLQAEEAIA